MAFVPYIWCVCGRGKFYSIGEIGRQNLAVASFLLPQLVTRWKVILKVHVLLSKPLVGFVEEKQMDAKPSNGKPLMGLHNRRSH